jgi:hypothetical protein
MRVVGREGSGVLRREPVTPFATDCTRAKRTSVGEPTVEVKLEERTKRRDEIESNAVWQLMVSKAYTPRERMMAKTEAQRAT